jgi:hypothetical protein
MLHHQHKSKDLGDSYALSKGCSPKITYHHSYQHIQGISPLQEAYRDGHVVQAVSVLVTLRLLDIHPLRTPFDHRYLQRILRT